MFFDDRVKKIVAYLKLVRSLKALESLWIDLGEVEIFPGRENKYTLVVPDKYFR